MWITLSVIVVFLLIFIFEYRIRRRDHIVLHESRGVVKRRKLRFYSRHFSLCISGSAYSLLNELRLKATVQTIPKKIVTY